MSKDIIKRWNERVIPNGWDKDPNGADHYVSKYGKQISQEKLKALRDYAKSVNSNSFVEGISKFIVDESSDDYMRDLVGKERTSGVNGDAQDQYEMCKEEGINCKLVETTIKHLQRIGAGTCCGSIPNKAFDKVVHKYGHIKVRGCYEIDNNVVGCVDMLISSEKEGNEISEMVSDCDGSLRFDGCDTDKPEWMYFESE